ncbi:MAG: DUF2452 domain-containing protein [Ferruginibacter sp.]|nr:DUF2452 domain-containing protein [Cytophagales bacterium]
MAEKPVVEPAESTVESVRKAVEPLLVNPISADKAAETPGLLPYAHTSGGALIKPEDKGKIKGRSLTAMRQQTDNQFNQLYQQMQVLVEQARGIQRRVSVSERIYQAEMGFEPIIGHVYYLYERKNGADVLSMVARAEWGRSFPFRTYLAKVCLLADHTWEVEYYHQPAEPDGDPGKAPDEKSVS